MSFGITRSQVLLFAVLFAGGSTPAQLAGTYTIDPSRPTAGNNFSSFFSAASALASVGVSGPVSFRVFPALGYHTPFSLPAAIPGGGAANPITFTAIGNVVIWGAATGYDQAIHLGTNVAANPVLSGPSHLTFDGIAITAASNGAGIMISGCSDITIRACRVWGCGAGIVAVSSQNVVIEDNEVYNVGGTPGSPASGSVGGGISSYYQNHGCVIRRNRVHDCSDIGIYVGGDVGTVTSASNVVVNNFVYAVQGNSLLLGTGGLVLQNFFASVAAHNTIVMPPGSMVPGINLLGLNTLLPLSSTTLSNNIVRHGGAGPCIRFSSPSTLVPTVFDHNLYDPAPTAWVGAVGYTAYPTLASWQGLTFPDLSASERATLVGAAGFVSPTDPHLTAGSPAFESGSPVPGVADDIDAEARPRGSLPDRGADEGTSPILRAAFTATPTSGPAPLTVAFTDASFPTVGVAISSWAWDFQNDGIVDSVARNPAFTFNCPGTYSVSLTVVDGVSPASTLVRANLVTAGPPRFVLASAGGGVGDLSISPVPSICFPGAVGGWTLVSLFNSPTPAGSGPFLGIYPDPTTLAFLATPPAVGNPIHFIATPTTYPNSGPLYLAPGTLSALAGIHLDAVEVLLNGASGIVFVSNVARVNL